MGPPRPCGSPPHTLAPASVEARLPEGPTYCQVSRKKDPSFCPSSALTRGHPHLHLGRPGRLEGRVPAARGRWGEQRGAQGARGHYTVRMGAQGRQRAGCHGRFAWHKEAGWEAMGGIGLGAEQGGSQISGARWTKHRAPLLCAGKTWPGLATGRQDSSQEELPASVWSPCNVWPSVQLQRGSPRKAGEGDHTSCRPPPDPHPRPHGVCSLSLCPVVPSPGSYGCHGNPASSGPLLPRVLPEAQPGCLLSSPLWPQGGVLFIA